MISSVALRAGAEPGVLTDRILIGHVTDASGPSRVRAVEKTLGAEAYFQKINAAGGLFGRKIEILLRDDRYQPALTVELGKKLIDNDHVFCLFQSFGTETSQALVPIISKANVPLIFPSSGAESLRQPVIRNVFTLRLSSFSEAEKLVNFAFDDLKLKNVGLYYPDDYYGISMRSAALRAFGRRNQPITGEVVAHKQDSDPDPEVSAMMAQNPQGVLILSQSIKTAKFIARSRERGYQPFFFVTQSAMTEDFFDMLKKVDVKIFGSRALPSLDAAGVPLIQHFRADLSFSKKVLSPSMLEGYVEAMVLVQALRLAGKDLTRKGLISALEGMKDYDIGGLTVSFSENNHQGLKNIEVVDLRSPAAKSTAK